MFLYLMFSLTLILTLTYQLCSNNTSNMYFKANTVKYAILTSSSTDPGTQLPPINLISDNKNKKSFKLLVDFLSVVGYLGCGDDDLSSKKDMSDTSSIDNGTMIKRHNEGDEDKHFKNEVTIPNPAVDTFDSSIDSKIGGIHVKKVSHTPTALLLKVCFRR